MNTPEMNEIVVAKYCDLRLTADLVPDQNGCMWFRFFRLMERKWKSEESFDLNANEVQALKVACEAWIDNYRAQQAEKMAELGERVAADTEFVKWLEALEEN